MVLFYLILFIGILNVMGVSREKKNLLKKRALEWSLALFFSALVFWSGFDGEGHFQFFSLVEWNIFSILDWGPIVFAVDGVSLVFLLLTTFLIPICILISQKSIKFLFKEFLLCLFFLEVLLIGVFIVFDLLLFYLFFWGDINTNVFSNWYLRLSRRKGSCFFLFFFFYFYRISLFFFL